MSAWDMGVEELGRRCWDSAGTKMESVGILLKEWGRTDMRHPERKDGPVVRTWEAWAQFPALRQTTGVSPLVCSSVKNKNKKTQSWW